MIGNRVAKVAATAAGMIAEAAAASRAEAVEADAAAQDDDPQVGQAVLPASDLRPPYPPSLDRLGSPRGLSSLPLVSTVFIAAHLTSIRDSWRR